MPDESALELDSRRRIYHYVEDNPGSHMRQIGRDLDIPMGTLEYHLRYLVDEGLLATREDSRYTRYFVKGQTSRHEKDVLAAIRQETPRRIVAHLLLDPGCSHGELLEEFEVSASTLSFHLNKLVEADVVEKEKSGRKNLYTVADEDVASRVLIQYRESFVDDVVDRFAEVWMDLDAGLEGPPGTSPAEAAQQVEAAEEGGDEAGGAEEEAAEDEPEEEKDAEAAKDGDDQSKDEADDDAEAAKDGDDESEEGDDESEEGDDEGTTSGEEETEPEGGAGDGNGDDRDGG